MIFLFDFDKISVFVILSKRKIQSLLHYEKNQGQRSKWPQTAYGLVADAMDIFV